MIRLVIDKQSGVSIHRQIVNQICVLIDSGRLKSGDRLPTERMLSEKYGISRGTVKAAYQELMRIGKIYAVQGSGTYIREVQPNIAQGNVRTLLSNTLAIALNAGVSFECVQNLLKQEYDRLLCETAGVRVCWVGVTREVLKIAGAHLEDVDHVILSGYLESEIVANPGLLTNADLIVTTENPYEQLLRLSGAASDKVLRLSLSLDEECIVEISRQCVGRRVLMCDMDALFMQWVYEVEGIFDPAESVEMVRSSAPDLLEIAERNDLLILPPPDAYQDIPEMLAVENLFRNEGKKILHVSFHFDRGSMINFQSRVLSAWTQKDLVRNIAPTQWMGADPL